VNGSYDGLRSLNVRNTVAVDLNSILCESSRCQETGCSLISVEDKDHILMAGLYGSSNSSAANTHNAAAQALRNGIIDLMWDSSKVCIDYSVNLPS
jgi:alpha,alpha-trehalase